MEPPHLPLAYQETQGPIVRISAQTLKLEKRPALERNAAEEHRETDLELLSGDGRHLKRPWTDVGIHSFICRVLRMGGACKSIRHVSLIVLTGHWSHNCVCIFCLENLTGVKDGGTH